MWDVIGNAWLWLAIAALVGLAVGWFLGRSSGKGDESAVRAERDVAREQKGELEARVADLTLSVDAERGRVAALHAEIELLRGRLANELEPTKARLDAQTERVGELEARVASARSDAEALRVRVRELEAADGMGGPLEDEPTTILVPERLAGGVAAGGLAGVIVSRAEADELVHLRARVVELETRTSLTNRFGAIEAASAAASASAAAATAAAAHSEEVASLNQKIRDLTVQLEAPRSADDDLRALRARVGELEANAADAKSLRAELAEARVEADKASSMRARIGELEALVAAAAAGAAPVGAAPVGAATDATAAVRGAASVETPSATDSPGTPPAPPLPDLAVGAAALGRSKLKPDDLEVIEGVGPKISKLLQEGGINGWWTLANTPATRLSEILAGAGPRYRGADASTWPAQAYHLSMGEWSAFLALSATLRAGREAR